MKPDICNSLNDCKSFGYCNGCSHGLFLVEGVGMNGFIYRFKFNPRSGPMRCNKDWEISKRQPTIKNKHAWRVFDVWHIEYLQRIERNEKYKELVKNYYEK